MTGVERGGVEVVGVEFQDLAAGGQGVVGAVEGEVEGGERRGGGRIGVEAGGFLIGMDGLDEAVVAFRDGDERRP